MFTPIIAASEEVDVKGGFFDRSKLDKGFFEEDQRPPVYVRTKQSTSSNESESTKPVEQQAEAPNSIAPEASNEPEVGAKSEANVVTKPGGVRPDYPTDPNQADTAIPYAGEADPNKPLVRRLITQADQKRHEEEIKNPEVPVERNVQSNKEPSAATTRVTPLATPHEAEIGSFTEKP